MRVFALMSLFALTLAACDTTPPTAAGAAQSADGAQTGSHIPGTDTGAVGSSDTHWLEQAQRNNSHF